MLEAVLFNSISFWVQRNAANGINLHDGYFWTYNSTKAFTVMFPYATGKQITRALNHLRDEGLLLTGNYNKQPYDRTLWYTLSEEGQRLTNADEPQALENSHFPHRGNGFDPQGKWISPTWQMDLTPGANGFDPQGKPIPVNNTVNTTINTSDRVRAFSPPTLEDVEAYCRERQNRVDPQHFLDYYEANGWRVGRNKMKDWKAAVRTWERNGYDKGKKPDYVREDGSEDLLAKWGVTDDAIRSLGFFGND